MCVYLTACVRSCARVVSTRVTSCIQLLCLRRNVTSRVNCHNATGLCNAHIRVQHAKPVFPSLGVTSRELPWRHVMYVM